MKRFISYVAASMLALSFNASCQKTSKEDSSDDTKLRDETESGSPLIKLINLTLPGKSGEFLSISSAAVLSGEIDTELYARPRPDGFSVDREEELAKKDGFFANGVGLAWDVYPPNEVFEITLTLRDKSSVITRKSSAEGRIAVSLFAFSDLYPPSYRERYQLKIKRVNSKVGVTGQSSTYGFTVRAEAGQSKLFTDSVADLTKSFKLGESMDALELGSFSVDGKCQGCIVEASLSEIRLIIKEFSELPVAPDGQTTFGISTPGRFSGLITRSRKIILQGTVQGQSTARAVVTTSLPASYTTVSPWCSSFIETAGSNCRISVKGVATDTYFKFVNVTPTDLTQTPTKLMGGSEGIANAFVSMDLAVVIKRDGVEIEKKSITLDSPLVQVYNASLPDWAGNLLRNALLSGAPEFDDSTSL